MDPDTDQAEQTLADLLEWAEKRGLTEDLETDE